MDAGGAGSSCRLNSPVGCPGCRFDDFAGTDTVSADFDPRIAAVHDGPNLVKVDVPAALGDVMSVADFISEARTFSANFTDSSHSESPEVKNNFTRLARRNQAPPDGGEAGKRSAASGVDLVR